MKCCLCNVEIDTELRDYKGNNALPIKDGNCCDDCNLQKVIPARLEKANKDKINEALEGLGIKFGN